MKPAPTNYARHVTTGRYYFFRGYWKPDHADQWATWRPVAGVPRLRLIGETPLAYALRQRAAAGSREAIELIHMLARFDVSEPRWQAAYERARELMTELP